MTLFWTEYCVEAVVAGKKPYIVHGSASCITAGAKISRATMRIPQKSGDSMKSTGQGLRAILLSLSPR